MVTYFSPSVTESLSKTQDVDLFVPMPWDTPWHWQEFLEHYKPKVLAIARTDAWPNLVWQTSLKNIPSLLFSATLPTASGRVASLPGRIFYSTVYEKLTHISCVSEEDKENFLKLTGNVNEVTVDGDTRFDQVISRVDEHRELPAWTQNMGGHVLVIGSSWPEDEKHLFPALSMALKKVSFMTILTPHEPTENHLKQIEENLEKQNLLFERYSQIKDKPNSQVVIVDKVGLLADLYRLGQVAFIGGSFKKSVHSVMEPAASGCLTSFGPHYLNNREAISLRRAGLAREVSSTEDISEFLVQSFNLSASEREKLKSDILKSVHANKGVSQKMTHWILGHN